MCVVVNYTLFYPCVQFIVVATINFCISKKCTIRVTLKLFEIVCLPMMLQ